MGSVTKIELRKDGSRWVYHRSPEGAYAFVHPIKQPCPKCPGGEKQ